MRLWAAALVAAVLALAGCGRESDPDGGATEATGTTETAAAHEATVYEFTGTTLDGERFDGTSLAGKPAVLWFWAPWCPTCRAQIGTVSSLAEQYAGDVAVIGVGGLDSEAAIEDLAAEIPHVTHLVDDAGLVWRHFGVTEQSTYTVIGADGAIESEGYLDNDELTTLVDRLAS